MSGTREVHLAPRYGLVADVHSNLQAFEVALEYLQMAGVERILCLGDLVGYGANPSECISLVRENVTVTTIAGNHDRQVIGARDPRMRLTAAKALEWTLDNVSPANARYLRDLPEGQTVDDYLLMVHGSIVERDAYILTPGEVKRNMDCLATDFPEIKLCFFAHTHVPMLASSRTIVTEIRETKMFQLEPNERYIINPGSVGQPRDKCPLASFGVFDSEKWTLTASARYNHARVRIEDRTGEAPDLNGTNTFSRLNPAIGVNFNPTSRLTAYASYNEGARAPTAVELTCADPDAPCKLPNDFLADPPLDEVISKTAEIGARGVAGAIWHWSAAPSP